MVRVHTGTLRGQSPGEVFTRMALFRYTWHFMGSEYAFHWVDIAKGLSSEAGVFSLGVFQAEISLGFVCLGGVHVFFVVVYSSNSP